MDEIVKAAVGAAAGVAAKQIAQSLGVPDIVATGIGVVVGAVVKNAL
jgi:hypothetical protein